MRTPKSKTIHKIDVKIKRLEDQNCSKTLYRRKKATNSLELHM